MSCKIKVSNSTLIRQYQNNPKKSAHTKHKVFGAFLCNVQAVLNRFQTVLDGSRIAFCVFSALSQGRFQDRCRLMNRKKTENKQCFSIFFFVWGGTLILHVGQFALKACPSELDAVAISHKNSKSLCCTVQPAGPARAVL